MANELETNGLDETLTQLAAGLSNVEKLKINTIVAANFKTAMLSDDRIPKSTLTYAGEQVHLRDAFTIKPYMTYGYVEDGFTSASKKAYIGRMINDGWLAKDRNGMTHSTVPGQHFWELTARETARTTEEIYNREVKRAIDEKVNR